MRHRDVPILLSLALLGCSGEADPSTDAQATDPQRSELALQAVDAGTGAVLTDGQLTVRYLVRTPITLDASAVDQVSASAPYRIAHAVVEDSLVVELRLEARSYHRLDTVLTVARGASAGPFTVRMTRRFDRVAATGEARPVAGTGGARPAAGGVRADTPPPADAQPSQPADPQPSQPTDPDVGIDRTALQAGKKAFQAGDWVAATRAYLNMVEPRRRTGTYAREYQRALVQLGVSHINLGEWAGALNALEEAVSFDSPGFNAYLTLGQAQCAVGRTEDGRRSLDQIDAMASTFPAGERPVVLAFVAYQRAVCSQRDFERAEGAMQRVQSGAATIQAYEAFIEQGEALNPVPTQLQQALRNARRRIADVRDRMRRGRDETYS